MTKKSGSDRADIYTRITDRIVEDLEKGVRPWMKPWSAANADGRISRPLRHNGVPYSGMNVLLLWSEQISNGFASSMWMTFKQALELGGAVRKGETGSTVVFASRFTKSEADGNGNEVDREIPFLKAYSVFNVEQIDGLPNSYYAPSARVVDPVERIESADRFFRNTGAVIRHGGNQAYYSPIMDHIQMPPFEAFRDAAGYAAVLSHEATHYAVSWVMPHGRGLVAFAPVFGHATVRHNQSASRNSEVLIKCRRSRSLAIRYAELSGRSRQQETVPSVAFPAADRVLILNGH
ncbi:ArdC-like ssDNA-binding domain-containing protein [Agrobacterium sp. B1(2019)]|uniref:ArdC family protein n=1 Tax=Agrobacterium sp. B1(2019) TaxID=2607032 RepID=UPI001FEEEE5A|nr:ArdC-like ssDNA-binding domain-containing protein [Agrobacterium sp. B1(2019)]